MNPIPQTNPLDPAAAFTINMGTPGVPNPHLTASRPEKRPGPQKKLGLLSMKIDSIHNITIGGKTQGVQCKDRRVYRAASGGFFCMGPGCYTRKDGPLKFYRSEKELREAHEPQHELERQNEIHVYGFWSPDDCNGPVDGCKACRKATEAARGTEGADPETLKACADHAGGCIGLLTPNDPAPEQDEEEAAAAE